jgi:hypothetical protein
MTVGQLSREMSSAEMTYWAAFARIEPFGGVIDDIRAGLPAAVYINAHRKREAKPISPLDFFPWDASDVTAPPREMTPEETAAAFREMMDNATRGNG